MRNCLEQLTVDTLQPTVRYRCLQIPLSCFSVDNPVDGVDMSQNCAFALMRYMERKLLLNRLQQDDAKGLLKKNDALSKTAYNLYWRVSLVTFIRRNL